MRLARMNVAVVVASALLMWGIAVTPGRTRNAGGAEETTAPKAVFDAFYEAFPRAKILDVSVESEGSQTYYEIESMDSATRRDLLYRADGTVYEMEESIAINDLPAAVKDTLKVKFPGAELQRAERITRGDTVQFEVRLENGEDSLEVLLDAGGTIKKQERVTQQDETSENDEGDKD